MDFLFFIVMLVVALSLFTIGSLLWWSSHWGEDVLTVKRRLQFLKGDLQIDSQTLIKTRLLSQSILINQVLQKIPNVSNLDIFLTQAGIQLDVGTFLFRCLIWMCFTSIAANFIVMALSLKLILVVIGPVLWIFYLQRQRKQRVSKIDSQLPDTLDLMARAMQAGHAFSSALLIVGSEGSPPIRNEFQITFDEINFGISTESALHHLTQRVASSDLRFFVIAVLIQLETGGNLTEILKSLAGLIRDRQRIAGSVRVLTAEGRMSAWILGLLPFAIAAILSVLNHEFISKLWTDPLGIRMLEVSFTLMLFGIFWMWRMVSVKV